MKKVIITFRATQEQNQRWSRAVENSGKTKTQICKAALDRYAKRIEGKGKSA